MAVELADVSRCFPHPNPDMANNLHHIHVLCPPGEEEAARRFYADILRLQEIPKPSILAADGVWFVFSDGRQLHVGAMREGDAPGPPGRSRAHFAIVVDDLDVTLDALREAGVEWMTPTMVPGWRRVQFRDPFGNNIEALEIEG